MNTPHIRLRRALASLCLALTTTLGAVAAETVTLYRTTTYQQIWGFGAAANHPVEELKSFPNYTKQQEILDRLFRTDGSNAGLSIVRLEINGYNKGSTLDAHNIQWTFMPAPNTYDWDTDTHQRWFAQQAIARGMTQFYAVPWTPPGWMKDNGSPNNGGRLLPAHYDTFASYIATYVNQYKNVFGIPIKWISVQNEPSLATPYASCVYNEAQMDIVAGKVADAVHAISPGVKVGAPENYTRATSATFVNAMSAATRAKLDFIPVHDYSDFVSVPGYGKPVFNAEVCDGLVANDASIDNGLKWGNRVAETLKAGHPGWMYWWCVTKSNDTTSQGLINLQPGNAYLANKRLFVLGQFARYLRPGYIRCLAASSSTNLVSVAGLSASGKVVVVVINNGTAPVTTDIVGIGSTTVTAHRTSATEELAPLSSLLPVGGKITVTLPAKSITSFRES